jgi:hypothetical protein
MGADHGGVQERGDDPEDPRGGFTFLADFENVPKWNYAIESTTKVSPGPVGMGTVYHQIRSTPGRAEEGFEVTVFGPGRRLAIEGTVGPFHACVSYLLESIGNATRLTNDLELEPSSALTRILAPLAVSGQGCCRREPRGVEADPRGRGPCSFRDRMKASRCTCRDGSLCS